MRKTARKAAALVATAGCAVALLGACESEATTVSDNLSTAADNFEILRRIVFVNIITDTNLLSIEGFCNLVDEGNQLEVTCRIGEDPDREGEFLYEKHFFGLADNATYFAEQLDPAGVDPFHRKIVFRPETIVPDVDLETSGG